MPTIIIIVIIGKKAAKNISGGYFRRRSPEGAPAVNVAKAVRAGYRAGS